MNENKQSITTRDDGRISDTFEQYRAIKKGKWMSNSRTTTEWASFSILCREDIVILQDGIQEAAFQSGYTRHGVSLAGSFYITSGELSQLMGGVTNGSEMAKASLVQLWRSSILIQHSLVECLELG